MHAVLRQGADTRGDSIRSFTPAADARRSEAGMLHRGFRHPVPLFVVRRVNS